MSDDARSTQSRIIDAARTEFAAFGLAGARIDRIAKRASASKERLYAYYSDKRELFLAVLELNLREFTTSVVLMTDDLPAFASSLYDLTVVHADYLRMIDWARLEIDVLPARTLGVIADYRSRQVQLIRHAQAAGLIDAAWVPEELMTMIFGLASGWVHEPGDALLTGNAPNTELMAQRRASVIRATERLIAPHDQ